MIYLLAFYWVVAGFAIWNPKYDGYSDFGVSMILGGFLVPARILAKVIR
jgi:hypothetical protein